MFDKIELEKIKRMYAEWEKENSDAPIEEVVNRAGIPIKPVYSPLDIADLDYEKDIGFPGIFPYMRGTYPAMYRVQPWMILQIHGFETAERTRESVKGKLKTEEYRGYEKFGIASMNLEFDVPSNTMGVDPDNPMSRGSVGKCGISMASLRDMETLLDGLPLDRLHISMILKATTPVIFAMFLAAADRKGVPWNKLRGNLNGSLNEGLYEGLNTYSPEGTLKLQAELIRFCIRQAPNINPVSLGLGTVGFMCQHDPVLEMGLGLSHGIALMEECTKRGVDAGDAVQRLQGVLTPSRDDFFETIAKIRATRKVWATVLRDRFEIKDLKALRMKTWSTSCCASFTRQQPLNNIVRGTIQGLANVLAGVNSMSVAAYDEPIQIPSVQSYKQSLRVQQLLLHETGITNVADPLAGSYYMEYLTKALADKAIEYINKIDKMGGWAKAMRNGFAKSEIERSNYEYQKSIWDGKRTVVGVNKYVEEEEELPLEMGHKYLLLEEEIIEGVKKLKQERENAKVERALRELKEVASNNGDVIPKLVQAASTYATMDEMSAVLKEAFGWRVWT